ncbi:MAG: hypothetical protein C0478_07715 [Planctomyces sp.]|nr:hypothetical protein [Planctomyces sp.]
MDLALAIQAIYGLVGTIFGILVSSLIGAVWLRLAAKWLRFNDIPYGTAFRSALITNFVVVTFNAFVSFNSILTILVIGSMYNQSRPRNLDFSFAFSPIYFMYATIFGVLVTAAIFLRTIPVKEADSRMTFADSLALASFYTGLTFAFVFLAGVLIFCTILGILNIIGI